MRILNNIRYKIFTGISSGVETFFMAISHIGLQDNLSEDNEWKSSSEL